MKRYKKEFGEESSLSALSHRSAFLPLSAHFFSHNYLTPLCFHFLAYKLEAMIAIAPISELQ